MWNSENCSRFRQKTYLGHEKEETLSFLARHDLFDFEITFELMIKSVKKTWKGFLTSDIINIHSFWQWTQSPGWCVTMMSHKVFLSGISVLQWLSLIRANSEHFALIFYQTYCKTRPGVDKVKTMKGFVYVLLIDWLRYSAGLTHHVLIYMGDLHLVLPAMSLPSLDAGILMMVQQVRLMMFSLNMVDLLHVLPVAVHLNFIFTRIVGGTILKLSYSEFFCGTPPSCLWLSPWF